MIQRLPVLLDTDVGDDIDDGFALALAARDLRLDLVGVTTSCGRGQERVALAQMLLAAAGRARIPVAAGAAQRLDGRLLPAKFSHAALLEQNAAHRSAARSAEAHAISLDGRGVEATVPKEAPPSSTPDAVELLLEASHRHPGLTIIAIGPLTNIALALRRDSGLARRARLVAMAGKLGPPYPDWNLRCDPEAARAVLASGLPTTLVGMQLTMRCKLSPSQMQRLFAHPAEPCPTLARCVLAWRSRKRRLPILHDALAVAAVAEPQLLRLAPRRVHVGALGFSRALRRGPANALVATALDLPRFHALLERGLLGGVGLVAPPRGLHARLVGFIA